MRVTIFGGHGKVALLTIPLLRQAGHDVQAVVRNPDHAADVEAAGAGAVVASVEDSDRQALVDLLRGQDAVVWSAGAGGGDPARTFAVDRDAAIRSMEAAEEAGVGRYVMVSFSGASPQHLVADDDSFRPYQDAKIAADERLRASRLAWTILGPGRLTTEPDPGGVNPNATSRRGDEAPRTLVARIIVNVLEDTRAYNRTLVFGAGDVPIDDWLAGLQVP